jgi:prepilin-type N-terminal cleavage/methylation domain-containing protein
MTGRGFTLVEIVVALALTLIVTGSIHRLLVTTQRLSRAQAAQLDLQSSVRAGAILIANELRELSDVEAGSADQTDILSVSASGMTYRAARGMGFLCESPRAGQLRVARGTYSGFRDPEASRDAVYLFVEGNPAAGLADTWLPLAITGVASTSNCPGTAGPAISIAVSGGAVVDAPVGTPLRVYEVMELRLYQSSGEWWLGLRSVSAGEAIQPVIGPLAGSTGFRLQYLNRAGMPTIDPASVNSIIATLRGSSNQPVAGDPGLPLEEELVTQVTLRNAIQRRPSE